jgi:serine protease Do
VIEASLGSTDVDGEFGAEDDKPFFAWLPPEDRLWRHPSESAAEAKPQPVPPPPRGPRFGVSRLHPGDQFSARAVLTLAILAGAVGALTASGVGIFSGAWSQRTTVVDPVISTSPTVTYAATSAGVGDWTHIEQEVAPSVVTVDVNAASGPAVGSGLMLFDGGAGLAYLVTDRSLFASGTGGSIEVSSVGGIKARATLVGQDAQSDVAVLAVSDHLSWNFAPIGTVGDVFEASPVIAMGAPSTGGGTLSAGTVISTDREVTLADGGQIDHLIAMSTPAMATTGGGAAAVDQSGQVIGVTVRVVSVNSADQVLTFAAPIDEVIQVARQLIEGHPVQHPWLGLTQTGDLPSVVASQKGIQGGASVFGVEPNSPASHLGISASDIILSLDGSLVDSAGTLEAVLDRCPTGQAIPIQFLHNGRVVSTTVKLQQEPSDA